MFVSHHCRSSFVMSWDTDISATETTCPVCNTAFAYTERGWTRVPRQAQCTPSIAAYTIEKV